MLPTVWPRERYRSRLCARQIQFGDHKGVRDFLADVTAFANTDSGDIVVGVREDKNGTAAAEDAVLPLINGFWRLFGVDHPPKL